MDFGKGAQARGEDQRQDGDDGDHETKGAEAEEAQAEEIVIRAGRDHPRRGILSNYRLSP